MQVLMTLLNIACNTQNMQNNMHDMQNMQMLFPICRICTAHFGDVYRTYDIVCTMFNTMSYVARTMSYVHDVRHRT